MWRWQLLLRAEPALARVLGFLAHAEAVGLLVFALDASQPRLARALYVHPQLLLLGDDGKAFASVLHCAAAHGFARVVQWLLRHRATYFAVPRGHAELSGRAAVPLPGQLTTPRGRAMAWVLRNSSYQFPAAVMYEAARQGDLEVVQWLHAMTSYEAFRAMEYAGSRGHLELVMWLYHQFDWINTTDARAVRIYMVEPLRAPLDVVNWIAVFPQERHFREAFATRDGLLAPIFDHRDQQLPWPTDDSPMARDEEGNDALDRAFRAKRFLAIDAAATRGDLELIRRLDADLEVEWPCSAIAIDRAATAGHLEVVKYLHAMHSESGTSGAICSAAGNGFLEVAQWLRANRNDGCRSLVMDLAATNGHLDVLRWVEGQYPRFACSMTFLPSIAANGHMAVLQHLVEHQGMEVSTATIESAIASGNLALFKWVLEKAAPDKKEAVLLPLTAEKAASSGNIAIVAVVVDQLKLWSPRLLQFAAPTGNTELLAWIYDRHRASQASSGRVLELDRVDGKTMARCAQASKFEAIEWLLSRELVQPLFFAAHVQQLSGFNPRIDRFVQPTAPPLSSSPTEFPAFAWDLHVHETHYWAVQYIHLVAKYCPIELKGIEWLPMAAAQRSHLFLLQQLASIGHPGLYSERTYRTILKYSNSGKLMRWFNATSPRLIADGSVLAWAVRYRLFSYLSYLFLEFEHVAHMPLRKKWVVELVIMASCSTGHLDVLSWMCGSLEVVLNIPATELHSRLCGLPCWRDGVMAAAQFGHVEILAWVHNKFGVLLDSSPSGGVLAEVADTGAAYGHLNVLRWVRVRFPETNLTLSRRAVESAIARRHIDVLQWLVGDGYVMLRGVRKSTRAAVRALLQFETDGFVPCPMQPVFPPSMNIESPPSVEIDQPLLNHSRTGTMSVNAPTAVDRRGRYSATAVTARSGEVLWSRLNSNAGRSDRDRRLRRQSAR